MRFTQTTQHGSNYFTGKNTIVDCGFSSCDKFISWGDPNNEKCIPLFNSKNLEIETKKNRVNIEKEIIPSKGKNNSRINQQNDKEKVTKIDTDDLTQESSVEEWGDLKKAPIPNESSMETNNDLPMDDFQTLDEIKTNNSK